jgi:2',3'-cyclic-nucleotide 2'-phosphodiesterase
MRILFIGDVVGRPGRQAVRRAVPTLRQQLGLDLVIANAENAAGGRGLTPETAQELLSAGADVLTGGNHTLANREVHEYLDRDVPVLRPLNYPPEVPGRGWLRIDGVSIVNLMGRTFMQCLDNPFAVADRLLSELASSSPVGPVIVDMHAEATSEKSALAWYLDGRVSAVLGTHTHVPTADLRCLPGGTAYVTDVGMVGPRDSILGTRTDRAIDHFLTQMPLRIEVATSWPVVLNSILLEVDGGSGRTSHASRVDQLLEAE